MTEIDYNVITQEVLNILKNSGKDLPSLPQASSPAGLQLAPVLKTEGGTTIPYRIDISLLKGDKGDQFKYSDFTPQQLEALKGEKGDPYVEEHSQLAGRDETDCHPMSAITGLEEFIMFIKYGESYGIEFDTQIANPQCRRIGNMGNHATLPIQSRMRRCLLRDDGTVNYYLNANDSTKKEDGTTTATLDGSDGQVMVEIPEHWRKFETEGTKIRVLISESQISGFHFVPKAYRSAYEAAIDRTIPAAPKLASVVNTTPEFRGGSNTAAWDGTYRSFLGKAASNIS